MKRVVMVVLVVAVLAALVLAVMPAQAQQGEFDSAQNGSQGCCQKIIYDRVSCIELGCQGPNLSREFYSYIDPVTGIPMIHFECRLVPTSVNGR